MTTSRFPELSWSKNRPILSPDQIPSGFNPGCRPMAAEWKATIADKYWARGFRGDLRENVSAAAENAGEAAITKAVEELRKNLILRDRILAFGGEEVCLPLIEEDLGLLLAHGEVWLPKGMILQRGEPCGCHRNTAFLWEANPNKVRIATGYYLGADGMWRQHSWCIKTNSRGGRVVETTSPASLYYGVCLTERGCQKRLEDAF